MLVAPGVNIGALRDRDPDAMLMFAFAITVLFAWMILHHVATWLLWLSDWTRVHGPIQYLIGPDTGQIISPHVNW